MQRTATKSMAVLSGSLDQANRNPTPQELRIKLQDPSPVPLREEGQVVDLSELNRVLSSLQSRERRGLLLHCPATQVAEDTLLDPLPWFSIDKRHSDNFLNLLSQ